MEAKRVRKNRMEYDALARVINDINDDNDNDSDSDANDDDAQVITTHPDRESSEKRIESLRQVGQHHLLFT